MGRTEEHTPEVVIKDGKVTRRSFVKGAGWITVTSALGAALAGCAPQQEKEEEPLVQTGESDFPDPDEGYEYKSACCSYNCTSSCHIFGRVKDGKICGVVPGDFPGIENRRNACLRAMALSKRTHDENSRVMYPMKRTGERGSGEFERISWDQAMDEIAQRMEETKQKYGATSCGFYSFTGNLTKLANQSPTRFAGTYGATTFDIEGIMGDHGASMGMQLAYGTTRAAHDTRDYINSEMIVLWGRNIADTHTIEYRYLIEAREKGAKVVCVDPRLSPNAAIADQWIPIKPQTDPALALGMMNVIIANDLHAKEWLAKYSVGPFLVKESDGTYLTEGEGEDTKWFVWDAASNQAVPYDTDGVVGELSGAHEVNGIACRTAFDHLADEVAKYTPEYTAEITGLDPELIESFALDYAKAKPAAIRMGQGMQRVWNSFAPFRACIVLCAVAGHMGVSGGGASHVGGAGFAPKQDNSETGPAFLFEEWADTGENKENTIKSSTLYEQIVTKDPFPLDFMWFANSNFLNMSPDANRVINEVFPNISTIVTVDPYWTWTAKYSDYVLPATNYWENWDFRDKTPWVFLCSPAVSPIGESKSDCEIMTMLAQRVGLSELWSKTDEEWVRSFVNEDHPAWEGFNWDDALKEGLWTRPDQSFEPAIAFPDNLFPTPSMRLQLYNDDLVQFGQEVPTYMPMLEDPKSELGQKYPLVLIQYHDRLNVHTQQIFVEELSAVQAEPTLWINTVDADARGLKDDDVVLIRNDRGSCKMKVFVTEGICPGIVATQSGWTPDFTIEGCLQNLTHLTLNPAEEFISQTSSAFYDVLVEVEKA